MRTFRDFMEAALYAPDGYYPTRAAAEDFYTAPELHPAFAGVLADEAARWFDRLESRGVPGPYHLVEMGSGRGGLSLEIVRALKRRHPRWARVRLVLVERCERLLLDSVLAFAEAGEQAEGYPRLEDVLPCAGAFLSNELVDAFPVHLLEKAGGRMREVYVDGDSEVLGELSTPELAPHASSAAPHLPEGGRHAVSLDALRWIRLAARKLSAGALVTIDYGRRFAPGAANEPRAFFRHTVGGSLLERPGRQDLTASVDFEPLIAEGERCGLETVSCGTLARFLMDRGILDWMPAGADPRDLEAYAERNRLKTLFHPEGMGEAYQVLVQGKGA